MPGFSAHFSLIFALIHHILANLTTMRRKLYDDYYMNYDYDLSNSSEFKTDPFILPNPESQVDVLPNVELPDDSLADADLRDHDFMDNLMYVYYGSHGTPQTNNHGKEIIIIGSVLSCAAQLLTVLFLLFRKNYNGKRDVNGLFLHLMGGFTASNLLFMLGVYATKSRLKCQIIAIILHYLHLLTAFWIFLYCYNIYKSAACTKIPRIRYVLFTAYGLPLLLTLLFYTLSPSSYETKKFCFVSVQRGMILNYMLPIATLIILTTAYSLNGIRKINFELSKLEITSSAESLNAIRNEIENAKRTQDCILDGEINGLRECKGCLKAICVVQTGYDIVWFIAVLALENVNYSSSMAVTYAAVSCILNWSICFKSKVFLPTISNLCGMDDDSIVTEEQPKTVNTSSRDSSDSIPLLIGNENGTEMRELRHEHNISTISG